ALVLAGPLHWNLYGIAAAGAIMLTVKNVVFTPIYGAHVLGKPCGRFFRELALIVGITAVTTLCCQAVGWFRPIGSWVQLAVASLGVSAFYGLVVYRFVLTAQEKRMVLEMVPFLRGRAT